MKRNLILLAFSLDGSTSVLTVKSVVVRTARNLWTEAEDIMLRMKKIYLLIAWAITCFLFFEVVAHAHEPDDATKSTLGHADAGKSLGDSRGGWNISVRQYSSRIRG